MFYSLKVACTSDVCQFQSGLQNDSVTGELTITSSSATTLDYHGYYTATDPMTPGSVTTQIHGTIAVASVGSGTIPYPTPITYARSALSAYAATLDTHNADGVCMSMSAAGQRSFLGLAGLSGPCVATLTKYFRTAPVPSGWKQMSAVANTAAFSLRNDVATVSVPASFGIGTKHRLVISFIISPADFWLINRFTVAASRASGRLPSRLRAAGPAMAAGLSTLPVR